MTSPQALRPSAAFVGASWLALLTGSVVYCIGLWNADMMLNEKGYYFTVLVYAMFSAVSLQKSVRDRIEGVPVTSLYLGLCWLSLGLSMLLVAVGLWNAKLSGPEKGFYAMAFVLCIFAAVAVQKNVRDLAMLPTEPRRPRSPAAGAGGEADRPRA